MAKEVGGSKKGLSTGKYLENDPGWLGPFNRFVWKLPNFPVFLVLFLGIVAGFLLEAGNYSHKAVSARRNHSCMTKLQQIFHPDVVYPSSILRHVHLNLHQFGDSP